jgi:hypothetical protein
MKCIIKNSDSGKVKVGDLIVLSNGLKMLLCGNQGDYNFSTINIETGYYCTTGIINLSQFYIGNKVFGEGCSEYTIVDIIKGNNLTLTCE